MITVGIPTEVETDPFDGYFSTITVWSERRHRWVCSGCKRENKNLYLTCGDSRYDDTVPMCNCKFAQRIGLDSFDCEKRFEGPLGSTYYK